MDTRSSIVIGGSPKRIHKPTKSNPPCTGCMPGWPEWLPTQALPIQDFRVTVSSSSSHDFATPTWALENPQVSSQVSFR